jgi:hypothetical protein
MAGDYNMIESQAESTSNSLLLSGEELEEWRILKLNSNGLYTEKIKVERGVR